MLAAPAGAFIRGTPDCRTGHCYEIVVPDRNGCEFFTAQEIIDFAAAQTFQGWPGHLLTIETEEEWNNFRGGAIPWRGILGAGGPTGGPYLWVTGPAAGTPVVLFGALHTRHPDACAAVFPRLGFSFGPYSEEKESGYIDPFPGANCGCDFAIGDGFVIEYEPPWGPVPALSRSWGFLKSIYR
jgi:hypothetical protein